MTVCIAAACRDSNDEPCVILCSDTRVDYRDLGSINTAAKLDLLGYGWCVQMAGDWANICHWKDDLSRRIQASAVATVEEVGKCLKESAEYFRQSAFCEAGKQYQWLLSGFPNEVPTLIQAFLEPSGSEHSLIAGINYDFACIGSGSTVAAALLTARECWRLMSLEYAAYLVYEAKRHSEKTGGVGVGTMLFVHTKGAESQSAAACFAPLTEHGKEQLESIYRGVWRVPFISIPSFPATYFTNPTDPQDPLSTKADPPRQRPSQA